MVAAMYLGDIIVTAPGDEKDLIPYPYTPGPQYLWDSPASRKLTDDLDIDVGVRTVKVGIYSKGKFVENNSDFRVSYMKKSRGKVRLDQDNLVMTQGLTEFDVIDVSFPDLILKLKERLGKAVIFDNIRRISTGAKYLEGEDGEYSWDRLVSTVPAPVFIHLVRGEWYAKEPLLFVSSKVLMGELEDAEEVWDSDFDYIYYPTDEVKFYRLTKFEYPHVSLEFPPTGRADTGEMKVKKDKLLHVKYAKVLSGRVPDYSTMGIKFLGRWSVWEPKYLMHHAIEEVMKWKDS